MKKVTQLPYQTKINNNSSENEVVTIVVLQVGTNHDF